MKSGLKYVFLFIVIFLILLTILLSSDTLLDADTCFRVDSMQHESYWSNRYMPGLFPGDEHKLYLIVLFVLNKVFSLFNANDPINLIKVQTAFFMAMFLIVALFIFEKILNKRINQFYGFLLYSICAPGLLYLFLACEDNVMHFSFFLLFIYVFTKQFLDNITDNKIYLLNILSGILLAICMLINISSLVFLGLICLIPVFLIRKNYVVAKGIFIMVLSTLAFYFLFCFLLNFSLDYTLFRYFKVAITFSDPWTVKRFSIEHLKQMLRGFKNIAFFIYCNKWLGPYGFWLNLIYILMAICFLSWGLLFSAFGYLAYKMWKTGDRYKRDFLIGMLFILSISIAFPLLFYTLHVEKWDFLWIAFMFCFIYIFDAMGKHLKEGIRKSIVRLLTIFIIIQIFWGMLTIFTETQIIFKNPVFSEIKKVVKDIKLMEIDSEGNNIFLPLGFFEFHTYLRINLPFVNIYYVKGDLDAKHIGIYTTEKMPSYAKKNIKDESEYAKLECEDIDYLHNSLYEISNLIFSFNHSERSRMK